MVDYYYSKSNRTKGQMKSMLNLLHKVQFFESFYRLDTLQNRHFDFYFNESHSQWKNSEFL